MGWDLSCPDWEARIVAGRSLMPNLPLWREEADLAIGFFNALRLPDVPGNPLLRDAGGDWFREIVAALFGSRDPVSNERYVHEIFALVGKGNSKTTNGAALMLAALLMNKRPRAEFLLVGPTQAISDLAFSQAAGMIQLDPDLSRAFKVSDHIKEILDLRPLEGAALNVPNGSTLRVKTFDTNILTGTRPVGVLLDELHLLGRHHATGKVLRQLRGGLEKNSEGFLITITTQSDEPPAGAFREELAMARAVRDGRYAGRVLPVLYEFPDAIARDRRQWADPANWPMVMPNLGRSLRLPSLIADLDAETTKGEHAVRIWASQHLNIEIGIGLKSDRWRGADHWEGAIEPGLTLETLLARSEVVCIGVDGGGLDDLLAIAVLGREMETRRRWLLWGKAWMHRSVLDLRKSEAGMFADLVEAGELVIVDDMEDAFADLAEIAAEVSQAGLLARVGLDPMGVGAIVDALAEREIEGTEMVIGVSQGWTLNGAIKTTEIKLASRALLHGGQKLLAWAVGNAKAEPKGNAITITKQISGAGKIDPLMAAFDAVALMSRNPEAVAVDVMAMIG